MSDWEMAFRPVVDRLYTRALEKNAVVRSFVHRAEVREAGPTTLLLGTHARYSRRSTRGLPSAELPEDGHTVPGTLRLDIVSDDVLRVRYCESDEAPQNLTPMVVGSLEPASAALTRNGDGLTYSTPQATVEVGLKPLTFHIRHRDGSEAARIGGTEKNYFRLWDSFNTGISRTLEGHPLATECFALGPQEAAYGFGEQFIGLDKTGQTIDLNMLEATGTTTPRSYKNIPFFMTTAGYGVFLNHSSRITCWVGSMAAADIQIAIEDDFLDYYLFIGSLEHILSRYTDLTGKTHVPPRWSFGLWQSKISYSSAEEGLEVVQKTRDAGFGVDVLHLDTHWFKEDWYCDLEFDAERFPDPAAFMGELARMGVKTSLWQLPYIPEGSRLFEELLAVDGFVKKADGSLYDIGICYTPGFEGRVGCIDFTNPRAVEVYQAHIERLHRLGAAVIKVDFGEEAPLDGVWHKAEAPHRAHNLYPLLYNKAVAEATHRTTGEWIMWARSAWAGSQRWPLHWGGDSSSNWDNIVPQVAGGLSLGMSGFCFWSMDIGGFLGSPDPDLFVRWLQAGLFLSHSRIHGFGDRELYRLPQPHQDIARELVALRYRLMPYLLATAADSAGRSVPMARPLALVFTDDPSTWRIADQWMLGDSLLVAPIFDPTGRRRLYLPEGRWTDWWTGNEIDGGRWMDVESDLETIPLYIPEGALVPLGPPMLHVDEVPTEEIALRISPFERDGRTSLRIPLAGEQTATITYERKDGTHVVSVSSGLACSAESAGAPVDIQVVNAR